MKRCFLAVAAVVLMYLHDNWALTHSRAYAWTFRSPNLVANWSFENSLEFWREFSWTGFTVDSRFKAAGSEVGTAKSGSFVAKVSGQYSGAWPLLSITSAYFPVNPSSPYTLSFYYRTSGTLSGTVRPVVNGFSSQVGEGVSNATGSAFSSQGGWTLYVLQLSTAADAHFASISLAEFSNGSGGTFYFDDVVLEEGTLGNSAVLVNRQGISEAAVFSDGLGRTHQSQIRSTEDGSRYLVEGSAFDDFARPETTYLGSSIPIARPTYQSNLDSVAKAFYGPNGPFDAKGYPFHRVKYPDQLSLTSVEVSAPDSAWQFGRGHTSSSGFFFRNDSLVPSSIDPPSGAGQGDAKYRLDWTRSPDSSFSLSWTNKLGQVVRAGRNITRSGSSADNWKWAFTRYEYYTTGQLKKVYTPIDDSASTGNLAEVSEFDAQGRLVSVFSPDRNLRKFWYNRQGQLRYSQDSLQRAAGKYAYIEYDRQGRPLSLGVQAVSSLPQDSVDKDSYNEGSKSEQIGYIYDDTLTFQSRTGFTLSEIMGAWKFNVNLRNAPNRLFCKYNLNQDNGTPKFASKDKFVADFYAYDDRGNLKTSWKFIGPIRDPVKRLQDAWFNYDGQDRLITFMHYTAADEYTLSNRQAFIRDHLGRVRAINGMDDKPLAQYYYENWGPLGEVTLGGLPSGDSATYLGYSYHSQGGLKEISATTIQGSSVIRVFQQHLGYEQKAFAASGVPGLTQAKYDGSITQQVNKYTSDLNAIHPVRAVSYGYDQLGRMGKAQAYWNTNSNPFLGNEDINTSTLTMDTTASLSSSLEYDLNGRIKGQRSASVGPADSARYVYVSDSYKLDKVTGKLSMTKPRDMSASGTFVYDANGALTQDKSKKMKIAYGWDGLPVSFTVDTIASLGTLRCCTYDANSMPMHFKVRYPSMVHHQFFDADGNRVSRVEVENKPSLRLRSTHFVHMAPGMLKEWSEGYHLSGRVKSKSAIVSLLGRGSVIGRIRADGKNDFFLKNNLGSVVRTVDDRGNYLYNKERVMDYLAYGSHRDLKIPAGSEGTRQKFTGKEFEDTTGLYAFGARWMDPELGMFTSPDPAGQFFNPFSYTGGNPINLIDPDGMMARDGGGGQSGCQGGCGGGAGGGYAGAHGAGMGGGPDAGAARGTSAWTDGQGGYWKFLGPTGDYARDYIPKGGSDGGLWIWETNTGPGPGSAPAGYQRDVGPGGLGSFGGFGPGGNGSNPGTGPTPPRSRLEGPATSTLFTFGEQFAEAGFERARYENGVAAAQSSSERSAIKAGSRGRTPTSVRAVIDVTRPGVGPRPGSGGTFTRTNTGVNMTGSAFRYAGSAALAVSVGFGAVRVLSSDDKAREAFIVGSSLLGGFTFGIAGASNGAVIGGALGTAVPIVGNAAGAIGGAVAGGFTYGMMGGFLGEQYGRWFWDRYVVPSY